MKLYVARLIFNKYAAAQSETGCTSVTIHTKVEYFLKEEVLVKVQ